MERTDFTALAAALVTVTLWGSAFVAIRDAGEALSPGSLALGRLLVSAVVLGAAAAVWREPLPQRRDLVAIAAFGVLFLGVYSVTLNAAERRVDAGTAAMLINTGPILIAILAGVFLQEGFPRWLLAGCAVAFAGCVLIGLGNSQASSRAGSESRCSSSPRSPTPPPSSSRSRCSHARRRCASHGSAARPGRSRACRLHRPSHATSTTRARPRSAG